MLAAHAREKKSWSDNWPGAAAKKNPGLIFAGATREKTPGVTPAGAAREKNPGEDAARELGESAADASHTIGFEETDASRTRPLPFSLWRRCARRPRALGLTPSRYRLPTVTVVS
eukprot:gene20355-biopygen1038